MKTIRHFIETVVIAMFFGVTAFIGTAHSETIKEKCLDDYQLVQITSNITLTGDPWIAMDGPDYVPGDTITIQYNDGIRVTITIDEDEKSFMTAIVVNQLADAIKNGKARAFRTPHYNYFLVFEECGSVFHLGPSDLDPAI